MGDVVTSLNEDLEGRYRIERELGRGGMATVYLADDLRHERKVALKVLKAELAAVVGAERFLSEIKTTARLQHPHILPLHDSGEAGTALFYVMPHVEGESLRKRLDRERQLPVDEAVRIATAVAQGLDYAHRHGVVHRDIKPGNVLLHDGEPVISDFGIALAIGIAGEGRLTETGLSLGTPHYMSPEQATGDQQVGPATDIYALGCVLYEMLVGEPPYTGSTAQAVLGKIIQGQPVSATEARRSVPANVDHAVRKALERVPADRFPTAQHFAEALADAGFRHGGEAVASGRAPGASWRRVAAVLGIATLSLAGALGWAVTRSVAPPVAQFELVFAEGQGLAPAVFGVDFALSPDGSSMVYVGEAPNGGTQLWYRSLADLAPRPIPNTQGAAYPSFSPDGLSVAFAAGGSIRVVSLRGGPPSLLVEGGVDPSWGPDGMIYFALQRGIYRMSAAGGEPEMVTSATTEGRHRRPEVLPRGRGLLVSVTRGALDESGIGVVGPEGGEVREILLGTMGRYAASGHLVYATADGTLMAAPFDLDGLDVTGPSVAVLEGIRIKGDAAAQFALSESGTLLYATGAGARSDLVWVSRGGEIEVVDPAWTGDFRSPALSRDGRRLAIALDGTDVWVKELDRGPSLKLTFEGGQNDYPSWTPDGGSVTFLSDRSGNFDLWTKRADGSSQPTLLLDRERGVAESVWTPDGDWLIYRTNSLDPGAGDILAQPVAEEGEPLPLVVSAFGERTATLSPDGGWLAYVSDESGQDEVYVVPFPNAGDAKWAISAGGGREPRWSRGGGELFYRSGQNDLVAVEVQTEPTFSSGSTTVLFSAARFAASPLKQQYDVAPDDQRFLMIRPLEGDIVGQLVWVQSFFEELRERVPR